MAEQVAVYAGSFDPPTIGHLWMIRQGADLFDSLWSARMLVEDPEAITEAHLAYFRAGARVATTASYQATFEGFAGRGLAHDEAQHNRRLLTAYLESFEPLTDEIRLLKARLTDEIVQLFSDHSQWS